MSVIIPIEYRTQAINNVIIIEYSIKYKIDPTCEVTHAIYVIYPMAMKSRMQHI